jgi:uncharacterized membrane protein (TIGR02234 family)
VCLALLLAAAALWAATRLTWFTAAADAVGRGQVPVTATGADLAPGLSAVALLAVAAVAAAVALAGPARRVLGGVVAAAGAGVAVTVLRLLVVRPTPADVAALPGAPSGGVPVGPVGVGVGPLPAALAAALLLAAGVLLVVGERRLPRFGARHASRDAIPDPDPDRAAWDALDAGRDPTADAAPGSDQARPGRTDGGAQGGAV